jgi:hypothetical protein
MPSLKIYSQLERKLRTPLAAPSQFEDTTNGALCKKSTHEVDPPAAAPVLYCQMLMDQPLHKKGAVYVTYCL